MNERSSAPRWGLVALAAWGLPANAWAQDPSEAAKFIQLLRLEGIPSALFTIVVGVALLHFISAVTRRFGERFTEHRLLAQQINTIVRFLIYTGVILLVVRSLFHLERETMFALTGTIAVAVGFALKDLAASVLAGIVILFDRPFQVGDRVTFGGLYGEVTAIGLRSVRLVTLDDSVVTIPNNKFLTDVVVSGNAGALDMQVVMDFFIAQDADLQRAKRIVEEAVRTSRFVYLEKPIVVLVSELIHETYLATRLRAKAYVLDVRYEQSFHSDVTERVKEGFAVAKITSPTRLESVRASQETKPPSATSSRSPRPTPSPAS